MPFTNTAVRKWFDEKEKAIWLLRASCGEQHQMQKTLVAAGFPATEMQALRDALQSAEGALLDLKMAAFTGLNIPPIKV